jgi:hypothetical protein
VASNHLAKSVNIPAGWPEAQSDPRRIDIDPTNPNRVYFSGNTAVRVGFVEVVP